jgi:D-xylose transport system substrate-binding protein
MTVYKAIQKEADAAAKIAIALLKGQTPTTTDKINNGKKTIPAQFETPVPVTKDNIQQYFGNPDYPTKAQICAGKLAADCQKLGL